MIQFEGSVPVAGVRARPRRRALLIGVLYVGLAALLVAGMVATKHAARASDGRHDACSRPTSDRAGRAAPGTRRASPTSSSTGSWPSSGSTGRRCRSSARRGCARARRRTSWRATTGASSPRRLGGRHRRRPRRDGGREPRLPRGRRPLGRLQHRAAARAGHRTRTSTSCSPSRTSTRARRCS